MKINRIELNVYFVNSKNLNLQTSLFHRHSSNPSTWKFSENFYNFAVALKNTLHRLLYSVTARAGHCRLP